MQRRTASDTEATTYQVQRQQASDTSGQARAAQPASESGFTSKERDILKRMAAEAERPAFCSEPPAEAEDRPKQKQKDKKEKKDRKVDTRHEVRDISDGERRASASRARRSPSP